MNFFDEHTKFDREEKFIISYMYSNNYHLDKVKPDDRVDI